MFKKVKGQLLKVIRENGVLVHKDYFVRKLC